MELPTFDARPNNPLFGPFSMWLCGDNPLDPEGRPETIVELAEALGVEPAKLHTIRISRGFKRFHAANTSSLDEIVNRRQDILDTLYEAAASGSVTAANAYLAHTKRAAEMADRGADALGGLSPADAADLTDEALAELIANTTKD